jgi:linoleoyl-CoA desaturase
LAIVFVVSLGLAIPATVTKMTHEGLHQSLTEKRWLNWVLAHIASPLGASWHWWCAKHNNAHHAFTNVGGFDHDLEQPTLRLSAVQPWHPWHRFQHLYVWVLYPFGTLAMVLVGDAEYILRGRLKGRQVETPGVRRTMALLVEKIVPMGLLVALALTQQPAHLVAAAWIGAFLVAGLSFSAMIAIGHYVETTEFPLPNADGFVGREWAAAQVAGSADVTVRNPVLRWYFGGLDHHTEHHLFPRMAHRNYPVIQPVVAETCRDFGVPYHLYPGLAAAYAAHTRHLRTLGRRPVATVLAAAPVAR